MNPLFARRREAALLGTHAIVDLSAYSGNVSAMLNLVQRHGNVELMAVIKANAYGHGAIMCARAALAGGANRLGVARIEEALRLREQGIKTPVLVLGPPNPSLIDLAMEQHVAITVGSTDGLERIAPAIDRSDAGILEVHLKVDTGMHRFGVHLDEVIAVARDLERHPRIRLSGLFTHFATADEASSQFVDTQQQRFEEARAMLAGIGITPPLVHTTNSAGCLRGAGPLADSSTTRVFRAGLALYGLPPSSDFPLPSSFKRVMTLKTRLGRVFTLPAGGGVSYGLTHIADVPTTCGTVPIGYGDGLSRSLSNQGWMSVHGQRCPILGRVCMDQTVIDLSRCSHVAEGDEVVVFGDGADHDMTAEDVAHIAGTINYEVTTAILPRAARVYVQNGDVVAIEDLAGLIEPA